MPANAGIFCIICYYRKQKYYILKILIYLSFPRRREYGLLNLYRRFQINGKKHRYILIK